MLSKNKDIENNKEQGARSKEQTTRLRDVHSCPYKYTKISRYLLASPVNIVNKYSYGKKKLYLLK